MSLLLVMFIERYLRLLQALMSSQYLHYTCNDQKTQEEASTVQIYKLLLLAPQNGTTYRRGEEATSYTTYLS